MTRRLLLLVLFASGASSLAQDPFDAEAWLRGAADVWDDSTWARDYEQARALSKTAARELNEATGWLDACREWWGDPAFEDDETGVMSLHPLPGHRYLVEVTCSFGAYQGNFALVLIHGAEADLLRYPSIGMAGEVLGAEDAIHSGFLRFDGESELTFCVFERGRGMGGCETLVTYEVQARKAVPVEARARACDDECETDSCLDPVNWPVVFPAR